MRSQQIEEDFDTSENTGDVRPMGERDDNKAEGRKSVSQICVVRQPKNKQRRTGEEGGDREERLTPNASVFDNSRQHLR